MKKIISVSAFILLFHVAGEITNGQASDLNIEIQQYSRSFEEGSGVDLIVNVQGKNPGYTFMLYDQPPWQGAKPMIIEKSENNTYTFQNIKTGVYHVCVMDAKENLDCKKTEVSKE